MLHKEHIFVDFRDWTVFMVKEGGAVFREGGKVFKASGNGGSFLKFQ